MPLNHYKTPLIGQFDATQHSVGQFLALSWGGIVGYLVAALGALAIYFSGTTSWWGAGLACGGLAFVVQSLAVDLPQVWAVMKGADPVTTNKSMATPAIILRRTWQTWLPLAAAIALYAW